MKLVFLFFSAIILVLVFAPERDNGWCMIKGEFFLTDQWVRCTDDQRKEFEKSGKLIR